LKAPRKYDLDKWIRGKFKTEDIEINKEGILLLEKMFNNELNILNQEINKIINFCQGKNRVVVDDILKIISRDKLLEEKVIFNLMDYFSERKSKKALLLLNEMLDRGESPLLILAMIIRQINLLLQVKDLKKSGKSSDEIARYLKIHPYPVKKCFKQENNFTEGELIDILDRFLQANLEIVTGKYTNQKMALEIAILESLKKGLSI